MKPAWDQLGDAFKDSKTVVIGDVVTLFIKDFAVNMALRDTQPLNTT